MFSSFASRCACATLIVATLLTGCTDELKYRKGDPANGTIGFTARLMSGWANTRSEQCDRPYVSEVSGGEAIADSLFLNMTTTPGVMTGTYDLHHAEGLEYDTDRKGEGIVTRATPVTPDNGEMYTDFGVSAYSYQGDWDETTATPDYFYNIKASKSGDGKYTLPASYFWPGPNYKMRFFAVAPYNNPYYVVSGEEQTGSPKITVDVPGNVGNQKDLLVATSGELDGNARKDVDLQFMHPLTAVRFVVGDDMTSGTINKINIHNVYCQGDLNLSNKQWTLGTQKRTFYQTLGQTVANQGDGNAKPGTDIGTASQTFMMMPQTLPEDAMISMEIKVGTTTYTVSAPIAGQVWQPGTTVTYQLSTTSINWTYTLTATQPEDYTYSGGTKNISVTCYRTHLTGKSEPVTWKTQFSEMNSNEEWGEWTTEKPSWLDIPTSGSSTTTSPKTAKSISAVVSLGSTRLDTPSIGTSQAPYNLSNSVGGDIVENTSNCYIITNPGFYRLPLVYGNAIKNGVDNPASYTSNQPESANVLKHFTNHLQANIIDPYIYNNPNCVPNSCNLEMQTAYPMISDLHMSSDNRFIEFRVTNDNVGSAVISVKNAAGQIMWSWHIWVTYPDINNSVPVKSYGETPVKTYEFLPVPIGMIRLNYRKRSVKVKFIANQIEVVSQINQLPYTKIEGTPYFQYGSKNPVHFVGQTWLYYLDINGIIKSNAQIHAPHGAWTKKRIADLILNPLAGYASTKINDNYAQNLWDANAGEIYEVNRDTENKTIYDPSPLGYCLPGSKAVMGFTKRGGVYNSSNKSHDAYTDDSKTSTYSLYLYGYTGDGGTGCYSYSSRGWIWLSAGTPLARMYGRSCYIRIFQTYVDFMNHNPDEQFIAIAIKE